MLSFNIVQNFHHKGHLFVGPGTTFLLNNHISNPTPKC